MGVSAYMRQQVVPVPTDLSVVTDSFDLSTITTGDLIFAGGAVVGAIILAQVVKRAVRRAFDRMEGVPESASAVIARVVSYAVVVIGVVVGLEALGFSLGVVGSLLLIITVVVFLAARPLLQDLGAGMTLQLRRPFVIGEQVAIEGHEGRVDGINARTVELVTVDGQRVYLPNRSVLDAAIVNLTSEAGRMTTFVAGVDYATDLDRATEVIIDALAACAALATDPAPQAMVEEFADSTINIACRFWHPPEIQAVWLARDEAMRAVKRALDADGITIAFPQRVVWGAPDAA